jgi:hypothetical protein
MLRSGGAAVYVEEYAETRKIADMRIVIPPYYLRWLGPLIPGCEKCGDSVIIGTANERYFSSHASTKARVGVCGEIPSTNMSNMQVSVGIR